MSSSFQLSDDSDDDDDDDLSVDLSLLANAAEQASIFASAGTPPTEVSLPVASVYDKYKYDDRIQPLTLS